MGRFCAGETEEGQEDAAGAHGGQDGHVEAQTLAPETASTGL